MTDITTRQHNVLDYIRAFQEAHGYAPTTREIAEHFEVCQNAAMNHLRALKAKGRITWKPNHARTLQIL